MSERELNLAEIPFEGGGVHLRYERYLAKDGQRWVRHGLFRSYHPSGALASEGNYLHGVETGVWRDYHANGELAAEGRYEAGEKAGAWKYWNESGVLEAEENH